MLLYSSNVPLTNGARPVISQFPVMDILRYCAYMPFWTLFPTHPADLAAQCLSGCTGQEQCILFKEQHKMFFCLMIHIYKVYHTLLNSWFKIGLPVNCIQLRFFCFLLSFCCQRLRWFTCQDSYSKCLSGHVIALHRRQPILPNMSFVILSFNQPKVCFFLWFAFIGAKERKCRQYVGK